MKNSRKTFKKALFPCMMVLLWVLSFSIATASEMISVANFYTPNNPENAITKRLLQLMQEDGEIKIQQWSGLTLPGTANRASLMMALAGKTAPDVGFGHFHTLRNDVKQGFLAPLNHWIGEDGVLANGKPKLTADGLPDLNGQIDDDEAIWEPWKAIPLLWRQVATVDGKVYGIPTIEEAYIGVVYRTDMVSAAGLDPNNPPQNWDELLYWCQKLTNPKVSLPGSFTQDGQRGIVLSPDGYIWLPWMQAAGGEPIIQIRKSPITEKKYTFSQNATEFITPDGENLIDVEPVWQANFASPEGIEAMSFYHKLFWNKFIFHPTTHEPINLIEEDIAKGEVIVNDETITFSRAEVISGVARWQAGQDQSSPFLLLSRGEVAMYPTFINDLSSTGETLGLNPDYLSWFPIPAAPTPKGRRVVQRQTHFIVAYEDTQNLPMEQRNRIWQVMTAIGDKQSKLNYTQEKVLSGMARFVQPNFLKAFGFEEYLRDVSEKIKQNFEEIENGKIACFTEPWMGFWITMDGSLNQNVISGVMTSNSFNYVQALKETEYQANNGIMFETSREDLDRHRPLARVIFAILVLFVAFLIFLILKSHLKKDNGSNNYGSMKKNWIAWALILPALVLIALWSYYPLLRGMVMAFQDYRITGESTFVGLDNFILLVQDKTFWMSLLRTCYFVFLNMILAFLAPIVLAILLTEIRHCKILFRTLFFLPQMTSGIVITLLWKLMYTPTPQGFFNQLIDYLNVIPGINIAHQTWLLDPKLAMLCCIIPTVWASMGMASLIYIAALHSIPDDYYEAAEIDGAGILSKLKNITIPVILPLIIINFVGAFIGTFQNMGNIFLMTFGGPQNATTVVSLKIWIEAYNNLRFSMATSMAWVLGSLLIGFTYMQIKFLSKVEYRKAKE